MGKRTSTTFPRRRILCVQGRSPGSRTKRSITVAGPHRFCTGFPILSCSPARAGASTLDDVHDFLGFMVWEALSLVNGITSSRNGGRPQDADLLPWQDESPDRSRDGLSASPRGGTPLSQSHGRSASDGHGAILVARQQNLVSSQPSRNSLRSRREIQVAIACQKSWRAVPLKASGPARR
jgi:hypothetical protein